MRNRWQLPLLALAGLAAAITFAAHADTPEPAGAHAGPGSDRWNIDNPHQPDTRITWASAQHTHLESEGWRQSHSVTEAGWTGSPGPSPCENPGLHGLDEDRDYAHCAYVVKHYNPWQINKDRHDHWDTDPHLRHDDVISSWCAVIARGVGGSTVYEPASTILFVDSTGQATCIDGKDHHSGGPGAEAGTQPTHRYHGDDDFIDQHGDTINAGITRRVAQVAANSHTLRGALGGPLGAPGHRPDEVVAQGRHHGSGAINYASQKALNLTGRGDHKTVMFWVWTERAADEPPVDEPAATTFAPVVSIGVPDDSAHVGSRVWVSTIPTVVTTELMPADAPTV